MSSSRIGTLLPDGIPFGLPTLAECAEMARRRREIIRDLPRKPWPEERPDPELERLRDLYPHTDRILVAFRLASEVETCASLLEGRPVDPDRVDPTALRWARGRLLVRLDLRALDLLLREPTP